MKNFKKYICLILSVITLLSSFLALSVSAATPYKNYFMSTVDNYSKNLPTPEAYEIHSVIENFAAKGEDEITLKSPEDVFIGPDGRVYIADTGNNRILVLEWDEKKENLSYCFQITGYEEDGSKLNAPTCVFVDTDGTILVCDYGNKRLVEFTQYGNFRFAYPTPESDILASDFNYQPQRVVKDGKGYIYVCSVGDSNGILQLSADGEFKSYYGTNKVALTIWESIARLLWSREDRKGSVVTLPYTFNNIYLYDGYVYATTTGYTKAQMRKINPAGSDVLYTDKDFSDQGLLTYAQDLQNFIDVTVDKDLNAYILDSTYGRIYEYDEWGRNLFVFGSVGTGRGQISIPKSLECDDNGNIYVLNGGNNTLNIYCQTDFAQLVHAANKNYSNGIYQAVDNPDDTTGEDNAFAQWTKVKDEDNFYVLALQSIGQILWRKEAYNESYDYFEKAEDYTWASKAYKEIRANFLSKYFSVILTGFIVVLVALVILKSVLNKYRKTHPKVEKDNAWTKISDFFKRMFRITLHPADGFEDIRYEGKGTYVEAFVIMAIYVVTNLLSTLLTSFIFRKGVSLDFVNWGKELLWAILPWIVISVVCYGVTTILYGEARLRDLIIGGAYCHVPFILLQLPLAIISQGLTLDEQSLYNLVIYVSYAWVVILVYLCIKCVNGFNPLKGVVVFVLTACGVACVVGLYLVVSGLTKQLYEFIVQFAKELSYLV